MATTDVKLKLCYYADCPDPPTWSVRTEASDKKDFARYTCDGHCEELTNDCRKAHTRYLLRPLFQKESSPETDERRLSDYPVIVRVMAAIGAGLLMLLIAPPVIGYYLIKVLFGWRPPKET